MRSVTTSLNKTRSKFVETSPRQTTTKWSGLGTGRTKTVSKNDWETIPMDVLEWDMSTDVSRHFKSLGYQCVKGENRNLCVTIPKKTSSRLCLVVGDLHRLN